MIYLFLLFMYYLFKCSGMDKGWLWFTTVMGILIEIRIFPVNLIKVVLAALVFKVAKDLYAAVRQKR